MQFTYFLFESLLLAAVEAGPLRKDSQFHYRRQDASPQNNSSTTALVQSQTSAAISSASLAISSVVTAAEVPQISAADVVDKRASSTTEPDSSDVLTFVPITVAPIPSQNATNPPLSVIPVTRKSTAHALSTGALVPLGDYFSPSILASASHTGILNQRLGDPDRDPRYRSDHLELCSSYPDDAI